ncbi:hypothetical protein LPB86_01855 [Pedobacter sp. MC2016-14]|uniref:hypothetical protein n=1 Tax=Pedobacter sp. MC2016-14 TaxID=2897327 RepID=UPI001E2B3E08|nr:hypothetical protein [Pedobacter sp. MC2016-14]MCD0486954.1 hypothetical protein [Pedobacter sp. MC2016-14]
MIKHKYQFCIRFEDIDANSAASKAVMDCNRIFSAQGYKDYTLTVGNNANRPKYYFKLLKELLSFFLSVKNDAIIGIQYPLLSINSVFKHFIKLLKFKKIHFFCVVHDLESLRNGGKDLNLIKAEVNNLNAYSSLIVHNEQMMGWLRKYGVTVPMISLHLFDYLTDDFAVPAGSLPAFNIVYAGNLQKSTFIYDLPKLDKCRFNLYGPGFRNEDNKEGSNLFWEGSYSPEQIARELKGNFGLIWDGSSIEHCDEILGNYLRYNNPHKCSLYIAAGLPLIAPRSSAIGVLIQQLKIGFLIDNLQELQTKIITAADYKEMNNNVLKLREAVIKGKHFKLAIGAVENHYDAKQ